MRKLLLALFLFSLPLFAQNPNPQQSYVQSMALRRPSLWMRFNGSSSTSFADDVSGLNFATGGNLGYLPSLTGQANGGTQVALFNDVSLPAGSLTSFSVQFCGNGSCVLPTAGSCTAVLASPTSFSYPYVYVNITSSFTVNVSSTSSVQTFTAGVDYTPVNVSAGQFLGLWCPTAVAYGIGKYQSGGKGYGGGLGLYINSAGSPPSGSVILNVNASYTYSISANVTAAGTVTPLQPGFDASLPNNYSAGIPYNGWLAAPNTTLGDVDWNTQWTMQFLVDAMAFQQAAGSSVPVVLASKGDTTNSSGNWWKLSLQSDAPNGNPLSIRVCMTFNASLTLWSSSTSQFVCTARGYNAVTNGVPYLIQFVNTGTGWPADNLLYVNGINGGGISPNEANPTNNTGNDPVTLSVSGGTGYANSTHYTSTGGGANCVQTGNMLASAGVPYGFGVTRNSGCPSNPTINLTAPTGTGVVITATATNSTISTATSYPLMIGSAQGMSSSSSQGPMYVDEFAEFPFAFSPVDASNIWYWMKWYQNILGPPPANPPLVIWEDDGGTDPDNMAAQAETIALALHGYMRLIGVISDDTTGSCQAESRQMLNQAGLGSVPVGVSYTFTSGGAGCSPSNLALYNASTDTSSASYISGTTLYRQLFAKYPTTPIQLFSGGDLISLAAFMQSGPDGISSLTGLQLMAQNATNGGAIYEQGSFRCTPSSPPNPVPCTGTTTGVGSTDQYNAFAEVYGNNGTTPLYYYPGTPTDTGPGVLTSRTGNEPYYLYQTVYGTTRQGWDSYGVAQMVTKRFAYSLAVGISGGTGYANYEPLSFTGGGSTSQLAGWLHSSGGVPYEIDTPGGGPIYQNSSAIYGIGSGFTSAPTLSATGTGSGVTLTPYLNQNCATISVSYAGGNITQSATSATCSNQYFINFAPTSILYLGGLSDAPWFTYFANSLLDPPPVGRPKTP